MNSIATSLFTSVLNFFATQKACPLPEGVMSRLSTSYPTSVPNVCATQKALPLSERFLSCPAAAQLLASERFLKPIYIDSQSSGLARTLTHLNGDSTHALTEILIAEEDLQTIKSLADLAVEIFNAQGTSNVLYQQARLGNVGMDSYARQIEEQEIADHQEHFKLINQCGNHWSMSPVELAEYTRDEKLHPEVKFFIQELECHADKYRQEWIENFQTIYCAKHPDDRRSCETKMTDLCNADMVESMTESEQTEFYRKRLCKLFPQAYVEVKNDPDYRALFRKWCPEVLGKFSHRPARNEL